MTPWTCLHCGASGPAGEAHFCSAFPRLIDDEGALGAEAAWRPGAFYRNLGADAVARTDEIVNSSDPTRPGPACAKHFPTHFADCPVCRDTLNQRVEMGLRAKNAAEPHDVDATLAERGARYGVFAKHADVAQAVKKVLFSCRIRDSLAPDQVEALEMIAHKLARIVNGDPDYADSWVDIAGYAKLVADRLAGVER